MTDFNNHSHTKQTIRKILSRKREQLSHTEREQYSFHITETLLSLDIIAKANRVHCYMSFGSEVSTSLLMEVLFSQKKQVYVPVVHDDILLHAQVNSGTQWDKDFFGIPTPIAPTISTHAMMLHDNDCIIIPMLGFDSQCMRLGYGKGYYDKFLPETKGIKIGLAFSCQYYDYIPADSHDIPMNCIITETQIFS
ncbi:MAG TPA: 5-formyltetrahydrofolate cyclo-ligase [Candidatus Kapabacteria bacterium]|jgi:5-formyltetrahydrofolate cyclo-ligase|nr:5-formyltetrahydrofolate cyclo-ligase [Candidatus Kapabacteria bacterium]HRK59021.1 5-formyltetrahydrofolate cyclo-ligase [Candidatus Kapabacteria bacterium]